MDSIDLMPEIRVNSCLYSGYGNEDGYGFGYGSSSGKGNYEHRYNAGPDGYYNYKLIYGEGAGSSDSAGRGYIDAWGEGYGSGSGSGNCGAITYKFNSSGESSDEFVGYGCGSGNGSKYYE